MKLLIKKGASVDYKDGISSPLHAAAFSGSDEICEFLISSGARVDSVDSERSTPLHKAAFAGNSKIVQLLIKKNAGINKQDDEGSSPLHKAAWAGKKECVEVLLKNGAEVDAQDSEDGTPLHNAAFSGHSDCIQLLISAQANINVADDRGASPLHLSVLNGNEEATSLLIKLGAFVDSTDDRNMTPLHHSIAHTSCMDILIKNGAEINEVDSMGRSPLFYAVKNKCLDGYMLFFFYCFFSFLTMFVFRIQFLILKGADTSLKDLKGQSLLDIASDETKQLIQRFSTERTKTQGSELKAQLKEAAIKFNQKPKIGIQFLIDSKFITGAPEEIASFLFEEDSLDKTSVGQYIGEGHDLNKKVLTCYVNKFDFSGQKFDEALRCFLEKFRLPSEAQQIDRCMEAFASVYSKNNPSAFVHEGYLTLAISSPH